MYLCLNNLNNILGSKEDLNWLEIDFNAAELILFQDNKHTQN